jgi:hypothetical protein
MANGHSGKLTNYCLRSPSRFKSEHGGCLSQMTEIELLARRARARGWQGLIHETERNRGMQREKMIILAGKYVLGLLSEEDAANAEKRTETDPEFGTVVAQWRDRLADLDVAEPIQPSSDLWTRIVTQLRSAPDNDAES